MAEEAASSGDELDLRADEDEGVDESKSAPADRAEAGPFDVSEVPTMRPYIDLGGIKIAPREGLQLRLEIDERANRVVAVTLEYRESLLQVQAFSAPKSSGLWHRIRADIATQLTSQGARLTEETSALGPELVAITQVPAEQGGGERHVRFVGVDGPRWLLRGVVMGRAVSDAEAREAVTKLFREMVVVRGDHPMPPSELLPMRVPAGMKKGQNDGKPTPA